MAGGITYDGVPVENGGRIFEGLKFWVAQRVPTRNTILEHIRNNSGVVVPLEKESDYLIADHARKDAPSGAISWKFITESVENGVVQLPDRYKIGSAPAGPRAASSSRPTKGTRAQFTAEEDAELAHWVLSHDRDRTGNQIYMQFEAKYPSHPWQSWRNRFVKKLMLLPHESLLQIAAGAVDKPTTEAVEDAQPDGELPDPTELMLQRRGQRVQQETAAQRVKSRNKAPQQTSPQRAAQHSTPRQTPPTAPPRTAGEREAALITKRNDFYKDLKMFAEDSMREIPPMQQIAGQPVAMWELSRAVTGQALPIDEIDWLRVAEDIGYAWPDMDAAILALQRCYEENLAEFLAVMEDMGEPPTPEELDESTAAQQAALDAAAASRAQLPSSPPAPRSFPTKRPLDSDGEVEIATPVKRRRLRLPREVPSTPDHERPEFQPVSNTSQRLSLAATPVRFETQPPPTTLQTRESSFDITPSQQLHAEYDNSSPIPLHFNSAARNRQVSSTSSTSTPASSKPSKASAAKRRVLPKDFRPPAPIAEESSLFVPDAGDGSPFPSALPSAQPPPSPVDRRPAQVVAATRRQSKEDVLSDLIQHYESLGYAHTTVVEGLRRTTMTPGLATVVMESLRAGQGVPTHHEGIWTDRDDVGLRLVQETVDMDVDVKEKEVMRARRKARRARDRLQDKHGKERMALRIKYLQANDSLAAAAAQQSA